MIFISITHNVAGADVEVQRHGDTRLELISTLVGDLGTKLNEPLTEQLERLKARVAGMYKVAGAGYVERDGGRWVPKRDHEYFRNAHELLGCATLENAIWQLRSGEVSR